jgi:monooxygenase
VLRSIAVLPRQGATSPWRLYQNWFRDVRLLRHGPVDDLMRFSSREPKRHPVQQAA